MGLKADFTLELAEEHTHIKQQMNQANNQFMKM